MNQIGMEASEIGETVAHVVAYLSMAIQTIQLPAELSKVLREDRLDPVSCAALNLTAAIMDCLAVSIRCIADKSAGCFLYSVLTSLTVWKSALSMTTGINEAKEAVQEMIELYNGFLISLNLSIGAEILDQIAKEKMHNVLRWLQAGEFCKRQEDLNQRRAPNSGTWFLVCEELTDWLSGEADLLVCTGIRT
jgi:hypothetical protein